jgi:hypothetical protein
MPAKKEFASSAKQVSDILKNASCLMGRAGVAPSEQRFAEEQLLRSELYSIERLEQHAKSLVEWYEATFSPGKDRLLLRLDENEKVLIDTHEILIVAMEKKKKDGSGRRVVS